MNHTNFPSVFCEFVCCVTLTVKSYKAMTGKNQSSRAPMRAV